MKSTDERSKSPAESVQDESIELCPDDPKMQAISFPEVLHRELDVVHDKRVAAGLPSIGRRTSEEGPKKTREEALQDATKRALSADLTGLSFSGGGIRSATINLGVLQALADLGLLRRFDYLSTVSGGGYIGSWLTALIERANREKDEDPSKKHGIDAVEERLRTERSGDKKPEDPAVTWLRRYSNYLTPRVGVLTVDTWAMVAVYLRNLLLNLLMLICGLAGVLLLPRIVKALNDYLVGTGALVAYPAATLLFGLISVLGAGYSFASLDEHLADKAEDLRKRPFLQQSYVQWISCAPLLAASFFAAHWFRARADIAAPMSQAAFYAAIGYGGFWLISAWIAERRTAKGFGQGVIAPAIWAAVAGVAAGATLSILIGMLRGLSEWGAYIWGAPVLLAWFNLLTILHTGLMGRRMLDRQREWLNRLSAWLWIYCIAWIGLFLLVVYGPTLIFALEGWWTAALASGWVVSTLAGLAASRGGSGRWKGLSVAVAPYVFAAGLLMFLAVGLDWSLAQRDDAEAWNVFTQRVDEIHYQEQERHWREKAEREAGVYRQAPETQWPQEILKAHEKLLDATLEYPVDLFLLSCFLIALCLLLAWRIDINEFSMHRFYRNRLVRAFLGAGVDREARRKLRQPFTGFYHGDDLELGRLLVDRPGPLHLINTALNLVAGEELAWQHRKAASFVLSPLYCGFDVWDEDPTNGPIEENGYRPTRHPDTGEPAYGAAPKPLTLGGAFAISGAAASPNMGFRSNAAFSFLLTVFNIRLGWWLGNPRHETRWVRSGPSLSLVQLFHELTGKTRGRTPFVYLSDGGHFENLGLYELVRRRCRYVISCDAGADPELRFDDLGNAIRKCRADFGVEIDIDLDPIRRGEDGFSDWHCAIGKIYYSKDRSDQEVGMLLYIKASTTGDEPEDILNYRCENPSFPHQTTADQFFDESQFESYRRLGHHIATEVLGSAVQRANRRDEGRTPESLWLALEQLWMPSALGDAFTRHTATLDSLFERQRTSKQLHFLDGQFYPEWQDLLHGDLDGRKPPETPLKLPTNPDQRREGFYFCNSLIQLMENVYLDLGLEQEYDHPDNRGWMNLFRHWTWSGMFRATWSICASTYGRRFQAFCIERLGLRLGEVELHPVELSDIESSLNFLECEQIDLFRRFSDLKIGEIFRLELVQKGLKSSGDEPAVELLRFGFGYALLDTERRILLYRVQDHLRTMGLGRAGLRRLFAESVKMLPIDELRERITLIAAAGDPESQGARERFQAEFQGGMKRFQRLVASVRRERRET